MPVFYRPARVVIDEGGGGWLAVVAVAVVAAVADALSAVLATVLTAVLVSLVLLAGAGTVVLIWLLRRNRTGLYAPVRAGAVPGGQPPALPAARLAAIEGKRPATLLGVVLDDEGVRR